MLKRITRNFLNFIFTFFLCTYFWNGIKRAIQRWRSPLLSHSFEYVCMDLSWTFSKNSKSLHQLQCTSREKRIRNVEMYKNISHTKTLCATDFFCVSTGMRRSALSKVIRLFMYEIKIIKIKEISYSVRIKFRCITFFVCHSMCHTIREIKWKKAFLDAIKDFLRFALASSLSSW